MFVTGGGLSLTWGQAAFSAPAVDAPDLRAAPAWPAELDAGVGDAALYDRALAEHAAGRWAVALELLDAAIAVNPLATRAHALAATVRAGVRELAPDLACDWAAFPDVILAHQAAAGQSEPRRRRLRARRLQEWLAGKTWFARSDRPDELALAFSADGVASRAVIRFDADGRRYALVTYGT